MSHSLFRLILVLWMGVPTLPHPGALLGWLQKWKPIALVSLGSKIRELPLERSVYFVSITRYAHRKGGLKHSLYCVCSAAKSCFINYNILILERERERERVKRFTFPCWTLKLIITLWYVLEFTKDHTITTVVQ